MTTVLHPLQAHAVAALHCSLPCVPELAQPLAACGRQNALMYPAHGSKPPSMAPGAMARSSTSRLRGHFQALAQRQPKVIVYVPATALPLIKAYEVRMLGTSSRCGRCETGCSPVQDRATPRKAGRKSRAGSADAASCNTNACDHSNCMTGGSQTAQSFP